jgi:cysteinyl-tRNA synthetase
MCSLGDFTAEELRYVLISGHFRQQLNFTWDSLHAARSALAKLRRFETWLTEHAQLQKIALKTRRGLASLRMSLKHWQTTSMLQRHWVASSPT